ncbi:MAG: ribonuclease D [Planctomycetota bacterium]
MLIRDQKIFEDLLDRCREQGSFAFDTEFLRENTYWPELCLIQIGIEGEAFAVDPLAEDIDCGPLFELLCDPGVEVIVHAGQQDMEIFFCKSEALPLRIFDTQVAAALLGLGDSIGYSRLVDELLEIRLSKGEARTHWERRPLTDRQLDYALNDVLYLERMRDILKEKLGELGRAGWLEEELAFYQDSELYRRDPMTIYPRVKGAARLDRRELAILRFLAAWREEEAREKNKPRKRIVSDDKLIEISRRKPSSIERLGESRGMHRRFIDRNGKALLEMVRQGLDVPAAECPSSIKREGRDPGLALALDLLDTFLRTRAKELSMSPAYLASRGDLYDLVKATSAGRGGASSDVRVLSGWRRELVGEDLLGLLAGRYSLSLDPETAAVVIRDSADQD